MKGICNAVFNILNLYVIFRVINLFLPKRKLPDGVCRLTYAGVWLINWFIYYVYNNTFLTGISLIVLLLIAIGILYKGSVSQKLVVVCLVIILGMVVEFIVWRMFIYFDLQKYSDVIGTLVSAMIEMIAVLIVEHFFQFNKVQYISKESYYNLIVVLFGNIILLYILADITGPERLETLVALVVIGLIDISSFYLFDKVNEGYRQKLESRILQERISMYDNQFAVMQQSRQNLTSLRHDLEKHTLLLKSYLEDKQYEKAVEYINQIGNFIYVSGEYVRTGNQEIDVILNYALGRAKQMGAGIETRIILPNSAFMPEFDLNILLGNLLDNALEALERTEDRYLSIEMRYDRGIFTIVLENSFDGNVKKKGEEFLTRKEEEGIHGIGMKNMNEIVEKYGGKQEIEVSEKRFKTKLILFVSEL